MHGPETLKVPNHHTAYCAALDMAAATHSGNNENENHN